MNKKCVAFIMACSIMATAWCQTLFTYGIYSVDAGEFLRAFNKTNTAPAADRSKAIKDYLNLYIASRLKIREAYERRYDTLPQLREELTNLRSQIIETYLNDPETLNRLVDEAFKRSRKDIHAAHIYVAVKNADTSAANKKINEAYQLLQQGKNFAEVAKQFSEDPSVATNKGDLGFITVFSLPYEFENIIYNLAPGNYSSVYKSKNGYHIFKNLGERKPLGKIKASQILIAFAPDADDAAKKSAKQLADSLYKLMIKGADFAQFATKYSNDIISASTGGLMQDFSVGQYDPVFEKAVFALSVNSISKPIETSFGYHIIKKMANLPVSVSKNQAYLLELRNKIEQNDRIAVTKKAVYEKVIKTVGYKKINYSDAELIALTDSLIDFRPLITPVQMNRESSLFKLGDKIIKVQDWINYAQTHRYKTDGSGVKPINEVIDEFLQSLAMDYYRNHLENFNKDFSNQLNEFKEGNLFFEIMQRQIWNTAQNDTIALKKYYEKNKSKYAWTKSADAVIFYCSDEAAARQLFSQLKKAPAPWKSITETAGDKVIVDSSRYDLTQIPNGSNTPLKEGLITNPVLNKNDNSASFAYIIKMHLQPSPRSFSEARGLVINDYQNYLEEIWVQELKKKYPVTINEKVLAQIINSR